MRIKLLIQLSAAALILASVIFSGCSEGSDRIYSSSVYDQNNQLATGLEPDYANDGVTTDDGYPMYDDGTVDDQGDLDGWIEKNDEGTTGSTGGSTKPLDFRPRQD